MLQGLKVPLQTAGWGPASQTQDARQPPSQYTVTEAVDYIGALMLQQCIGALLN